MKIKLTGTPNLGHKPEARTEEFEVLALDKCIHIKDKKGKVLISFNPFFDGGSICIKDFSSIIIDVERWNETQEKCVFSETINTSAVQIQQWKEDSETLAKIREAQRLLKGDLE